MARVWRPLCSSQWRSRPPSFLPHLHKARILNLAVQAVDLQVFLKALLFCLVSERWERQFMLSLRVSGCETCIILMLAPFVMYRMFKPCNRQRFTFLFYTRMFKRVFFLSNLAILSKAQTLLDRTVDTLVRNSKSFPSPTPHFRSSFTWEQLPSSSPTSSSKIISDICSFTSLAATIPWSFAFYFMGSTCAPQLHALWGIICYMWCTSNPLNSILNITDIYSTI